MEFIMQKCVIVEQQRYRVHCVQMCHCRAVEQQSSLCTNVCLLSSRTIKFVVHKYVIAVQQNHIVHFVEMSVSLHCLQALQQLVDVRLQWSRWLTNSHDAWNASCEIRDVYLSSIELLQFKVNYLGSRLCNSSVCLVLVSISCLLIVD